MTHAVPAGEGKPGLYAVGCTFSVIGNEQYVRAKQWDATNILGDPEVTANIYCKSRNHPNKDTQNYCTDLR